MSQATDAPEAKPSSLPSIAELGPRFFEFVSALERPLVFLDVESTGTDPQRDRLLELSLVRVSPLPVALEAPRTWRVNPGVRIPEEASDIHGIRESDLKDAPSFDQIADEVREILEGSDLAGFSLGRLDIRLLQNEFARCKRPIDFSKARLVDAQVIYHRREPRDLAAALRFYRGRELHDAHGAEADALASLEVFAGQLERYADLPVGLDELHTVSTSHSAAFVDRGRRFMWRDGEPVFNFGKLKGRSLREIAAEPSEREYLRWIATGPFEDDTRDIVRQALEGRIRSRAR